MNVPNQAKPERLIREFHAPGFPVHHFGLSFIPRGGRLSGPGFVAGRGCCLAAVFEVAAGIT